MKTFVTDIIAFESLKMINLDVKSYPLNNEKKKSAFSQTSSRLLFMQTRYAKDTPCGVEDSNHTYDRRNFLKNSPHSLNVIFV
jgi:hypothetical protein